MHFEISRVASSVLMAALGGLAVPAHAQDDAAGQAEPRTDEGAADESGAADEGRADDVAVRRSRYETLPSGQRNYNVPDDPDQGIVLIPMVRIALGPGWTVGNSASPEIELDGTVGLRLWTPLSRGQPSGPHFLADLEASYVFHGGPVGGHGFAVGGAALFGDVVTVHGGFTAAFVGTQVGDGPFGVGVRAGLRARALAGLVVAELTYELRAYEPVGAGVGGEVHMVRLMFGSELLSLLLLMVSRPPSFHFPI